MIHLTWLVDSLFAVLSLILLRNILVKHPKPLIIPLGICVTSLCLLLVFYLTNTTEIVSVWLNSHTSTPLLYKIAGLWGAHEGSMLLFFTCLVAWSALLLREAEAIRLASLVLLAIGLYVYLVANPFVVLAIKATAGQDLNPALQNPYLAIHPPILYLGQSLCLVLWVWACVSSDHPKSPKYTSLCFGLISVGLILGARWAYGELGWGGFWFWDPVETVSLFPWLTIIAAVHDKRSNRACLLLSFPMVMLGVTLIRSGVLVSVHSFGLDLHNGIWLSIGTALVWLTTIVVFCKGKVPKPTWLSTGFLSSLALLVALITLPIVLNYCFSINITIDTKFFQEYINPLILLLIIFAGFAPHMQFTNHGWSFACASLTTVLWCWLMQPSITLYGLEYLAIPAVLISFWLIFSTLLHLKQFFEKGFVAAHLGVGLCILGASHAQIFTQKVEVNLSDLPIKLGGYLISYHGQELKETEQVSREICSLKVNSHNLAPERQYFHISKVIKHQPDWIGANLDHVHATVFSADSHVWQVELILKPLITIFWLGLLLVVLGIGISTNTRFKKRV